MKTKFKNELMSVLESSRKNDWRDNWDFRRFGSYQDPSLLGRLKVTIREILRAVGLHTSSTLSTLAAHEQEMQWLYEQLADEESRELLVNLMAYRTLGYRKVRLPLNTPRYWQKLDSLERKADSNNFTPLDFLDWKLDCFDLTDEGYPIQLYARPSGVFTQLILQQYRCVTAHHEVAVAEGDTVIDAGGCYGDTALYFAQQVGQSGRVFSFEFMPNNITVFQSNLSLNPNLSSRIKIISNPLWSSSELKLFVEGVGPASRVVSAPRNASSVEVRTLCIDDLAQRENVERVDFIKMDIEGSELEALKGAEKVIRRHKPKLAISVYHRLDDFWTIPLWIESLGLGYRLYLRHFTIHAEETVLFAEVAS